MYVKHTEKFEDRATPQIKEMVAKKFRGVKVRGYECTNATASISAGAKMAWKHGVDYVVFAANIYGRGVFVVGPADRNEMVNSGNITLRNGGPFWRVTPEGDLFARKAS